MFKKIFLTTLFLFLSTCSSFASSTSTQLVIAPHFDDASLPLGGMLAQSKENKVVVTVFTGKPAKDKLTLWDKISGFFSSFGAVDARLKENDDALRLLGASSVNLGFLDYQYRDKSATTTLIVSEQVKAKLSEIIAHESQYSKLKVYFPAYFGPKISHKDHVIIHDDVLQIIRSNTSNNIEWYVYEDMPYTIGYYRKFTQSLRRFLELHDSDYTFAPLEIPLTESDLDLKSKSIAEYKSQIKAFHAIGDSLKEVVDFNKTHCDGSP